MMKKRFAVIILPVIIFVIFNADTDSFAGKNFLWRIQSKTSTVYALGSIHLLKKDIYPLDIAIENAFNRSDSLVVEANINDIDMLNFQQLMAGAVYANGDSLDNHVSKNTWKIIEKETAKIGLSPKFFCKQRPWFLAITLEALKLVNAGYDPEYGIDKYFLTKATGRKKVIELESINYQIDLLSGLNDSDQELFLLYTLKNLETLTNEADNMVNAWKSGDAESMETIIKDSSINDAEFYPVYNKLIVQRNKDISLKIDKLLKKKGTYFVVVGAAHFIGKQGIIQLLKERGYSLNQL